MNSADAYAKVTDRLIAIMGEGIVPWAKPWTTGNASPFPTPVSVHGHRYRGINFWLLASQPYTSPVWLTYAQAAKLGGNVCKGQKGTAVLLWKQTGPKPGVASTAKKKKGGDDDERKGGLFATTFTVFNVQQCEKLPADVLPEPSKPMPAHGIVKAYLDGGPQLVHGGDRACYSPSLDIVHMPVPGDFKSPDEYTSTLFHELTHSTGHDSRLKREIANVFGDHAYSKEELVAELGAAFLCARAGVRNDAVLKNSAAYLQNWLGKLQDDRKLFVQAASAAQKAADLVLGEQAAEQAEAA